MNSIFRAIGRKIPASVAVVLGALTIAGASTGLAVYAPYTAPAVFTLNSLYLFFIGVAVFASESESTTKWVN